jgi:hypothetical protein
MSVGEQAQAVLRLFPKKVAEEAELLADAFDLDEQIDIQSKTAEIRASLQAFYESVKGSFKVVGRQADWAKIAKREYSQEQLSRISGAYVPGAGGGEGQLYMSAEKRLRPFLEAIAELGMMAEGAAPSADRLREIAKAIKNFGSTLAHENVHKASDKWSDSLDKIVNSLRSGSTALGKEANKLVTVMSAGKGAPAHLRALRAEKEKQERAVRGGTGGPEELKKATDIFYKTLANELLAYQADPEAFKQIMRLAGTGDEAVRELEAAFAELREREPELIEAAIRVTRQAAGGVLESIRQITEGAGPATGVPSPVCIQKDYWHKKKW